MGRVFAYCRVSTHDQNPDNQKLEIKRAGFEVEPRRIVEEKISGSVPAMQRPGFARLIDRLEDGDILIVTKLDRLGRDAIDVQSTIKTLAELGIRIYCLALGAVDLTSATGKVTLGVLTAIAEFERDLLRERTHAGINRARAEGKKLGRKPSLTETEREKVWEALQTGESVSSIARNFKTTRQTILRIKKKLALSGE